MTLQMMNLEERLRAKLPEGFEAKSLRLEDAEPLVDLFNEYAMRYLGVRTDTVEDTLIYWQTPGFNLASDTLVVRAPHGKVVGYAEVWNIVEPYTRINVYGVVHPDFEKRGIGTYLMDWIERKAEQELPRAPEDARVIMNQGADAREVKAIQFMEQHGFQRARQYYHMHIEFDQPPAATVLPAGYEIRPFQGEAERTEMLRTLWEAFHDHWGFINEPFEAHYRRWMHWAENSKEMDPALWFVVLKNGQIAGACLCSTSRPEDPDMAWINQLGVRREYRKQGLGLALLQHAFGQFYRRGKKRAGLGVDAGSLTGAVRLYETAGMHAARIMHTYHKVLREGKDLSVQALQE